MVSAKILAFGYGNKAGYTATLVACVWAGAVFKITWAEVARPKTAKTKTSKV